MGQFVQAALVEPVVVLKVPGGQPVGALRTTKRHYRCSRDGVR